MIIQNIGSSSGAIPARLVSNDAPAVTPESPTPTTSPAVPQTPSAEQLKSAVTSINKAMQQSSQNIEFTVDSSTKTPVVKMTDTETGKVISQFPSEAVLGIAQSIDEYLSAHQLKQGLLLKQQA
ncbi:flagellar protein FlaG [Sideroxydans lithotrophicus]|uniref:Flagellar protein FlaG protein n=1 Tax=Sideroxydans lithotrophicus (strain ES-1) TaxID=580332 RepID=D5CN23_SIDLE|nr:flagellar protein FlaG [Sideroxydans lithotrophicus]ADE10859.1 flagellar protein FlaG protein [Sideroxydans lithotrophicus ES-1]